MFYVLDNKYKIGMDRIFCSHMIFKNRQDDIHNFIILYKEMPNFINFNNETVIIEFDKDMLKLDHLCETKNNICIYTDNIELKPKYIKNIFMANEDKVKLNSVFIMTEDVKDFGLFFNKIKNIEDDDRFNKHKVLKNKKNMIIRANYHQALMAWDCYKYMFKPGIEIPSLRSIMSEDHISAKICNVLLYSEDRDHIKKKNIVKNLNIEIKDLNIQKDISTLYKIVLEADLSNNFSDIENIDIRALAICLFKGKSISEAISLCHKNDVKVGKLMLFYSCYLGFEFMARDFHSYIKNILKKAIEEKNANK